MSEPTSREEIVAQAILGSQIDEDGLCANDLLNDDQAALLYTYIVEALRDPEGRKIHEDEIERLRAALAARQDGVREAEYCEIINVLEDLLGDVLGYLEGELPNAKPALLTWINAYFEARKNGEPMLVRRLEQGGKP